MEILKYRSYRWRALKRGETYYMCQLLGKRVFSSYVENMANNNNFKNNSDAEAIADGPQFNPIHIQMLSKGLHKQVFGPEIKQEWPESFVRKSIEHLKAHNLWDQETPVIPDLTFKLPKLCGSNIDEHFANLASKQSEPYVKASWELANSLLPPQPSQWVYQSGWTAYTSDGFSRLIDYPEDDALVLDVEVCMSEGSLPTLAVAVSPTTWYSWCSGILTEQGSRWAQNRSIHELIPLETKAGSVKPNRTLKPRVVVGHNVGFDRSCVKEQYLMKGFGTRFVDTMSLHIACSGLTSFQRAMLMSLKTGNETKDVREQKTKMRGPPNLSWLEYGSMNSLADVYKLYCGKQLHSKETRDVFVKGSLDDVRNDFQSLMTYCSNDVMCTHEILVKILPMFFERFPHPVTFAGMLEMGQAYLPVNKNWERYISDSEDSYHDLQKEQKLLLMHLANDACELLHHDRYKTDLWLSDLDWKVKDYKLKKSQEKVVKKKANKMEVVDDLRVADESVSDQECKHNQADLDVPINGYQPIDINSIIDEDAQHEIELKERLESVLKTSSRIPKKKPVLSGYPEWYRELCPKNNSEDEDWMPGPSLVSSQVRVAPKLLKLTWDGYPVYYSDVHGWGYLVPGRTDNLAEASQEAIHMAKNAMELVQNLPLQEKPSSADEMDELETLWAKVESLSDNPSAFHEVWKAIKKIEGISKKKRKQEETSHPSNHKGNGPYNLEVDAPGFWFFRLPHKDGEDLRVGNPLAKYFLKKIEDGTLQAQSGAKANKALNLSKMTSYWKNARKRITSQNPIWFKRSELPKFVTSHHDYEEEEGMYGAIIPKVVVAGTLTRRAVEPTWLTASNAYPDRVGSELKSMIQTPPGYHFVGADVDSQELWIAAILGDANFAGIHGSTAFGWMTLQGKKSAETDLHSKTAKAAGVSREQAKVLNYGRIYGAGIRFAERLLMQFNHKLTAREAKEKAGHMYSVTKGVRRNRESRGDLGKWVGGSESEMFNKLEEIAQGPEPRTPVLGCRITRALEPQTVNMDFMTSRVNWVVQSSAVDYLHLMLVCMRWLMDTYNIDGRFCISIHDEVRYLVKSKDRYRAALALQITNLLTRSMFAYKLDMNDLPQSVAFFSSVDIDTVLRKEVTMDCVTPSNPHGLEKGYGIPTGEALDIYAILEKTRGGQLKP